jgi:MFS family permease
VAAAIFMLQTLAMAALLLIHSTTGVIAFVVLFGAGFGAVTPARAALVAEYYGPAFYGSISGVLALCLTGARALAPVGAGIMYDATHGYTAVLWTLLIASTLAAVAVLLSERSAVRLRA